MVNTMRVQWDASYRIIRSIYPPIDLFEDIADPRDWEALASVESKTNPRIWDHLGRLDLVPPERRVAGVGASNLMAPFVHVSPDRPGRFTRGHYGVYSAGNTVEVAIREVAHHHGRFMGASNEPAGWTSQFRELITPVDAILHDLRGDAKCHEYDDYSHPQTIAETLRAQGSNGVLYNSVRSPSGECIGLFWPDVIAPPVQGDHFVFHWDGHCVDRVRNCRSNDIYCL